MSKFPLDLNQFKKIKMDKHSTTLKHKSGHEIKVVHSALKPELQAALHKMPTATEDSPTPQPTKKDISENAFSGAPKDDGHGHREMQYSHGGEIEENSWEKHERADEKMSRQPKGIHRYGAKYTNDPKAQHEKVLAEMKQMPKPKLYAYGGTEEDGIPETAPEEVAREPASMPSLPTHPRSAEQIAANRAEVDKYSPKGEKYNPTVDDMADDEVSDPAGDAAAAKAQKELAATPSEEQEQQGVQQQQESPSKEKAPLYPSTPENQQATADVNAAAALQKRKQDLYADAINASHDKIMAGNYDNKFADYLPKDGKMPSQDKFQPDLWRQASAAAELEAAKGKQVSGMNDQALVDAGYKPAGMAQPAPTQAGAANKTAANAAPAQEDEDITGMKAMGEIGATGAKQLGAAKMGEARAIGAQADRDALIYQAQAAKMKEGQDKYQQYSNEAISEALNVAKDLKDGHLQDIHLWEDRSTLQKFRGVIGLILGGMGQGLLHSKSNPAADFMQQQIDNEVKKQTAQLGQKKTVLDAYHNASGDIKEAQDRFRMAQAAIFGSQLLESANRSGNQVAIERAKQFIAKDINIDYMSKLAGTVAQNKLLVGSVPHGKANQAGEPVNPQQDDAQIEYHNNQLRMLSLTNPAFKEAYENSVARTVPGHGQSQLGPVPDHAREAIRAQDSLISNGNDLLNWIRDAGFVDKLDPRMIKRGKVAAQQLIDQLAKTEGGVLKADQVKRLESSIGEDPSKFLAEWRYTPQLEQVIKDTQKVQNSYLKQYRLRLPQEIKQIPRIK